jgi:hypothetical protein
MAAALGAVCFCEIIVLEIATKHAREVTHAPWKSLLALQGIIDSRSAGDLVLSCR